MGLRKFKCYRKVKRAYTRNSKYKKKAFIKTVPHSKIAKFDDGNLTKKFEYQLDLKAKEPHQIRHNALESSRILIVHKLDKIVGVLGYYLKLRVYPHHVLRENKMLAGAHADRLQKGMQKSFGRPIGIAAQIKKDQPIFSLFIDKTNLDKAKKTLEGAGPRLPSRYYLDIHKEVSQ